MRFALFLLSATGCVSDAEFAYNEHSITAISFRDGTSIDEAVQMFGADTIPDATLRIRYPDHASEVAVSGLEPGEVSDLLSASEFERLTFILGQFNPEDPREIGVYDELRGDLISLENGDPLVVASMVVGGTMKVVDYNFVTSAVMIKVPETNDESLVVASDKSVKDYTSDASYVPEGGTSTIWTSGTLQKFWMDEDSADSFDSTSDGIEIDTLISPRSAGKCGSTASSNMPNAYMDTEAFDWFGSSNSYRNCSVGTLTADELLEGELYWTWHTFKSFSSSSNPKLYVMFQPSTWGWYVLNEADCSAWGAYCMFSRSDMPTEYLISYYYNDAPGTEVSWTKN